MILWDLSAFVCPTFFKIVEFRVLDFQTYYLFKRIRDFLGIVWSILGSPKTNNIGFGSHGHVRWVEKT